jgi:two-component system chemotaxis response regulator CheB
MGKDGAQGMAEMKQSGAYSIAQDEKSSVVWGMPGEAVALGCVDEQAALPDVARRILKVLEMS